MKPDALPYPGPAATAASSRLADFFILAKVRVNALVVATTAGGYYMATHDVDAVTLVLACAGTALVASGASAFNQVHERETDKLMVRTRLRPVADGRMTAGQGRAIAAALSLAGLAVIWLGSNLAATLVALATLAFYAVVYTPLKRRSSLATVVGAVPGALPPLIGWAAAGGTLASPAPWTLFFIMFLWQLPHFLAIAWIYREDYARAGLPMLPVVDPRGTLTGRQTMLWAVTIIPFSLLPTALQMTDAIYGVGAALLGLAQLVVAIRFGVQRTDSRARTLFYASIIYLPLLWLLMCVGRR
jgi:protoheme IX farnesyltransferase